MKTVGYHHASNLLVINIFIAEFKKAFPNMMMQPNQAMNTEQVRFIIIFLVAVFFVGCLLNQLKVRN
jgi:hypothetical protein